MARLYIANLTRQINLFAYRIPENTQVFRKEIGYGEQIILKHGNRELSLDEINYIVEQHQIYGLTEASRINAQTEFVGLCYSIDKPINVDKIVNGWHQNDDKLIERSTTNMANVMSASKAYSENLIQDMINNGIDVKKGDGVNIETEIIGDSQDNDARVGFATNEQSKLKEKYPTKRQSKRK